MRRYLALILTLLFLITSLPAGRVSAGETVQAEPEPDSGFVLCPPDVYPEAPENCLPLGPSQTLSALVQQGIPYPLRPLPAYPPPSELSNIPYQYYRVDYEEGAVVYIFPTLEAAMGNQVGGEALGPGRMYFSYVERVENKRGVFYYLRRNVWIRSDYGTRVGLFQPFQGKLFSSTPRTAFGWVLGDIKSRTTPGFNAPYTGKSHYRFEIVPVYATQLVDEYEWNMIGPDEWVEGRHVASLTPRQVPPEGILTSRWIEINLAEQTLAVYEDNQLTFATIISTGRPPFWTRQGLFQIYQKKEAETMRGTFEADHSDFYYLEDVPWTMYFDEKRALHGAYWHAFWGYPTSHGCVNTSLGDSHWLYDWAVEGDWVYVFDPSGNTPTDPSQFGAGAP